MAKKNKTKKHEGSFSTTTTCPIFLIENVYISENYRSFMYM